MSSVWPSVRLGDVLVHNREYVDTLEPRLYPKLSVKLYGKGVVLDSPTDAALVKMKRHQLAKAGHVILSEIWGKKGAVGIVPPEGEGALCTSHFFLFDVRTDRVDTRWLRALFSANFLADQLDTAAKGTTSYAAVRPATMLACEVPLPPLADQQRIVARIEEVAGKVKKAGTLREVATKEAQALWASCLRARISGATGQDVPLENVCEAIIDNLHTNPRYTETGVPCVRSPDVGWGSLDLKGALRTDEEEYGRRTVRGEPREDDVVLVREGGGTGKAALVLPGNRFSLGQRVMMLRPDKTKVLPKFFLYQLLSPRVQEDQIRPLSKGSASPHLNIGALKSFALRLPTLAVQQTVVDDLDRLRVNVQQLASQQKQTRVELDALLPAILDRAFKGTL